MYDVYNIIIHLLESFTLFFPILICKSINTVWWQNTCQHLCLVITDDRRANSTPKTFRHNRKGWSRPHPIHLSLLISNKINTVATRKNEISPLFSKLSFRRISGAWVVLFHLRITDIIYQEIPLYVDSPWCITRQVYWANICSLSN